MPRRAPARRAIPPFLSYVTVPAGQVALFARGGPQDLLLIARLADGYPSLEGSGGGWEDVPLPGQTSATVFRGRPSERMPLRLILGGWPVDPQLGNLPCHRQIEVLHRMAVVESGRRGEHPPLIRLKGAVPHGDQLWFIDEVAYDDALVVGGHRVRAHVTVTLKRYVPLRLAKIVDRKKDPTKGMSRHTVKKGETAWDIARKGLGARTSRDARALIRKFRWASDGKGRRREQRRGALIRDPRRIQAGDIILIPKRKAS